MSDDPKDKDLDKPARPQDRAATDEHDGKPMRDLDEVPQKD